MSPNAVRSLPDLVYARVLRRSIRLRFGRLAFLRWACFACLISTTSLLAQDRAAQERGREQWQNVDLIFAEMGVRPGATVADIGAGDGFFTSRLARSVGGKGRVFAVDIDDAVMARLRKRLQEDGIDNVTIVKGSGFLSRQLIAASNSCELSPSPSSRTAVEKPRKRAPVRRSRCEHSGSATPGHSLEDLRSGRTRAVQWNAARTEL
jgi:FkbM family methyltransferase